MFINMFIENKFLSLAFQIKTQLRYKQDAWNNSHDFKHCMK